MNRAFERFFGLRRIELIGVDYRQLAREKLAGVVVEADEFLARALHARENSGDVDLLRCRIRRSPSVEERWLECKSFPIEGGLYAGGRVERCTDITRYRTAEKVLRQLNSRLVEAKHLGSEGPSLNATAPADQLALGNISSLIEKLRALFSAPYSSADDSSADD